MTCVDIYNFFNTIGNIHTLIKQCTDKISFLYILFGILKQ